jgi:hypothetical protein
LAYGGRHARGGYGGILNPTIVFVAYADSPDIKPSV